MRKYQITFVLHGGEHGCCRGLFANDWAAIDAMLDMFHDAARICARRVA